MLEVIIGGLLLWVCGAGLGLLIGWAIVRGKL
jgi:hypothetical protein